MNNNKLSFQGLITWLVCVIFFLYEFLLRTILGTFQVSIINDLNLSSSQFTLLSSSAFLFIYGIMQIAIGPLIIRIGIKKAMLLGVFICSIATLGFAFCDNYIVALLFRGLMGFGGAFGAICVLVTIYAWMPYSYTALFIGLSQFIGTMGPMAASGPLSTLSQSSTINWRSMFFILSCVGGVLFILISIFVKKHSTNDTSFTILKKSPEIKKNVMSMIKNSQAWFIVVFCSFVYFSLEYLSENECKNFLITKGFSPSFSSYMITISWLGYAIGSPLFGFISDRLSRRKPILIYSAVSTMLSLGLIIYFPLSENLITISFFSFGLAVGASNVSIVTIGEQFHSENVSAGLGINNALSILFISLVAPCVSLILNYFSQGETYSLSDFHHAFVLLILLPFFALIIVIFKIKETFGRSTKEPLILNTRNLKE